MKTPKLIRRAAELLGGEAGKRCEKKRCIKEILSKLKKKECSLKEKLKKEKDPVAIDATQLNLAVIFAQRKKGVKALKELKTQEKTRG
jgi:hypothetical protein